MFAQFLQLFWICMRHLLLVNMMHGTSVVMEGSAQQFLTDR